jgi:shikimate kinase
MTHVLLIGPRASGKSTVGPALARRRGVQFVDLDRRTVAAFPETTVRAIWAAHGEAAWRAAEVAALRSVLAEPEPLVVALGGGTPVAPGADAALRTAATPPQVVYLRVPVAELARRLGHANNDRPALRPGTTPEDEVKAVLAEREPAYRRWADRIVDGTMGVAEAVDVIAAWLADFEDEDPGA